MPDIFRSVCSADTQLYFSSELAIPEDFSPRGRWKRGPLHTFCDDYRQEFFWRRPEEGLIVALSAGIVTAPDFTIYNDDPPEWRLYQAWRSAVVALFWQSYGVRVLPVVSFASGISRYVLPGSVWAIRGPSADSVDFRSRLTCFIGEAKPSCLVVFGKSIGDCVVPVVQRKLVSSKCITAQKEGSNGR